jgi:hypothetical protein
LCAAVREALEPPPQAGTAERRNAERRWFGRRVIARGAGRPRVLLGRDLSTGGMRVENASGLGAGDELELALHSAAGEVPLVLRAAVLRTSGSDEAALVFPALSSGQRVALEKLMFELGACGEGPTVVSEVLEPALRLSEPR